MAYSNGRLPSSALAPIPGSGPYGGPQLRNDAARAYRALHAYSMKRWGISMALHEGSIGRSYRNFHRQQLAYQTYGAGQAAYPGTSNHGWGVAVDLMSRQQRWVIDQVGHLFGFSKRWSDASHEWWHIKYRSGDYPMVRRYTFNSLRYGDQGKRVKWVQWRLRVHGIKRVKVDGRWLRIPRKGDPGRGYFGKATRKGVRIFQRRKGLTDDGVVGQKTWNALKR